MTQTRAHIPVQVGNTNPDGTPMSRHSTPGDVCAGCSNLETGLLVPINECPAGWQIFMNAYDQQELNHLRASGLMRREEDPRYPK